MNQGTEPWQLEQHWLSHLEEQYRTVNRNLQAFLASPPPHSSSELASWVSYMATVENYFAQYKALALYLSGLGYSALFARVQQVLAEMHQAAVAYAEMHKNALEQEAKQFTAAREASKEWFETMQRIMQERQKAFDAANAQWNGTFRRNG
jgi:hypothetical protein